MKIIAGIFKNRNIYMPFGIRPTQHTVRKSLFDLLGQDMEGVAFLDLFGGSGAVAIEAVSRGAKKVVIVEKDPKCARVIVENMELLGIECGLERDVQATLIEGDSFATIKMMERKKLRFDVVFIDPPFGRGLAKKALKTLEAYDILHPHYMVVVSHDKKETLPDALGRFRVFKQKKYGSTNITIYKNHS